MGLLRFNLAALIPYLLVPFGLTLGIAISYAINAEPHLRWDNPVRFMPVLLGPGLGVILGLFIRNGIILHYYENPLSDPDPANLEAILNAAEKPRRKKTKGRKEDFYDE